MVLKLNGTSLRLTSSLTYCLWKTKACLWKKLWKTPSLNPKRRQTVLPSQWWSGELFPQMRDSIYVLITSFERSRRRKTMDLCAFPHKLSTLDLKSLALTLHKHTTLSFFLYSTRVAQGGGEASGISYSFLGSIGGTFVFLSCFLVLCPRK